MRLAVGQGQMKLQKKLFDDGSWFGEIAAGRTFSARPWRSSCRVTVVMNTMDWEALCAALFIKEVLVHHM